MNSNKPKTVKTATVNGTKYRLLSNGELWTQGGHRYKCGHVSDPANMHAVIDAHERKLLWLIDGVLSSKKLNPAGWPAVTIKTSHDAKYRLLSNGELAIWPTPTSVGHQPHDHSKSKPKFSTRAFGLASAVAIWPTPTTQDNVQIRGVGAAAQHPKRSTTLGGAVQMWPTPTQDSAGQRTKPYKQGGLPLTAAVTMWPTPTVVLIASKRGAEARGPRGPNLAEHMVELGHGGKLNPDWVEWLMGWPIGWSASNALEMDRFRQWYHLQSKP